MKCSKLIGNKPFIRNQAYFDDLLYTIYYDYPNEICEYNLFRYRSNLHLINACRVNIYGNNKIVGDK